MKRVRIQTFTENRIARLLRVAANKRRISVSALVHEMINHGLGLDQERVVGYPDRGGT
jgi:hypothetical protein